MISQILFISLLLFAIGYNQNPEGESQVGLDDKASLGLFAAIMVPLAILIGFATASVGFTCWSIVVPLLWVGFGIDVYDALFTAVATDWLNASLLTAIYAFQGRVVWKEGTIFSAISAAAALGCMFGAKWVIDRFKDYIKRGLGWFILVISLTFVLRGYKQYKLHKEALEKENEQENLGEEEKENEKIDEIKIEEEEKTLLLSREKKPTTDKIRIGLMTIAVTISGGLSGLIGIGSGLNFVMGYLYLLDFELLEATSTGCYNMAVTMLAVTMGYLGIMRLNLSTLWPYLIITILFGLVGTIIGAFMSYKIAPMYLNFIIAVILIVVGVGAIVEPYFLEWIAPENI